jgi:UDP-N-acetylglucosamine diphosphorylase/glucosamine-1-phosphate N-acetyltransferase
MIGIVVGYKRELVVENIQKDSKIHFVDQINQNGTGDAVKCAKELFAGFDGTVFILCGDVPLLKAETLVSMLDKHHKSGAKCTVLTMFLEDPDKYGRMVRDDKGNVREIIEFKDASDEVRKINEINTGIYCFDSKELFKALEKVDNNNAQKEYYLTDVLKIMYNGGQVIESEVLKDISEAAGVNSQIHLAELEKEYYNKIRMFWMNNGVSIENPETVLIGEDAVIENDVYISAGVMLKGKTFIGKNAYIGPNCVIVDSVIGSGSRLEGMNVVIGVLQETLALDWYAKL